MTFAANPVAFSTTSDPFSTSNARRAASHDENPTRAEQP
eukprot:CAMPEP_0173449124 /NCGR_PEP_ID=MMETSP1357-20121228/42178_1 /TAXON_ID=77926 /ORGANISM="Hemiselmis rufescens, Strain PCC563" /LENGTH=38 /DNA_ID= /DNA_START= /DNA_END= /DNA_ORIENTATION=